MKYIRIVTQQSSPSASRTFSSLQTETLSPLHTDSHPHPQPRPPPPTSYLYHLTPLGASCEWDHKVFVLLCLWLLSLSIMSFRLIPIVTCLRMSFLFRAESYSKMHITFCVSAHLLLDMQVAYTCVCICTQYSNPSLLGDKRTSHTEFQIPYY